MSLDASTYAEPKLYIDGEWLGAAGRQTEDVINPATGEVLAVLPHASAADLDHAAGAAERAFDGWRKTSAYDRARIIRRAAELLRARVEPVSRLLTLEEGKPLAESKGEILNAADIFDWMADEGRRAYGRIVPSRVPGGRWLVTRQPVGPVAAFTPWNFPIVISARKIAASLAAGCTIVLKPAEETPAAVLEIARAFADAGLPKGVLNIVYGVPAEVSGRLIRAPEIRKVTFTGSTAVGRRVAVLAAESGVKPTTLELGGHAPVLIFDDADIGAAVTTLLPSKYRNAGQVCMAPTRFYVQDNVHDRFVGAFAEASAAIRVGDGLDRETVMGPLANERRLNAMEEFVADAVARGARLKTGGERLGNRGNFYAPTVLADVPPDARIMNEEPFGPVAVTARFSTLDEGIAAANRLPYGLAAYAFTSSARTARVAGEAIEAGVVGINNTAISMPETPFGGVKESGYGSEGGSEGLDGYLVTRLVSESF